MTTTSAAEAGSKAVVELLSPDRLAPYLSACGGDEPTALALYRWNSDLAAAFFEQLGHLEIMLRNALDARLVRRQERRGHDAEWFDDPGLRLGERAHKDIVQAKERARGVGRRRHEGTIARGKVIAELSFGFWRYLIARQHQDTLWPDLARAFPHAPGRALQVVELPVKRLHLFRNRIAHHEGIWHIPVEQRRDDLLSVLGYIAPAARDWTAATSRIDQIMTSRPVPSASKLVPSSRRHR
ncbi:MULTISPECIES: Abi family protein [Streptomyces]|jgi:hypothetical protein|uniref:Abi-like protein n=2 Tax=Streptomyces albidoflavus TaxID=1886 RepID=A0AB37XHN2_9ACTN|nr:MULTISPECIES: Abi family protein [Streptomyces]QLA57374.1 Abi family protein [Streptomyces violascens]AWL33850.1 hypothetical protein B9S66_17470 [Streptomyces sp. SM17]MBK3383121.1 Abi family protein [Streptomyces sp. DEF147AK]MBK3387237.1 Abi family protein [Streptomyces sp. DEF1AK]MBT2881403.1 hypothetical protein [Streptomyces sp. McG6]